MLLEQKEVVASWARGGDLSCLDFRSQGGVLSYKGKAVLERSPFNSGILLDVDRENVVVDALNLTTKTMIRMANHILYVIGVDLRFGMVESDGLGNIPDGVIICEQPDDAVEDEDGEFPKYVLCYFKSFSPPIPISEERCFLGSLLFTAPKKTYPPKPLLSTPLPLP